MFAVLKTGGKQYKVASGDVLVVEKLAASPGESVEFNEVLMLGGDGVTVGSPFVDGAAVTAEVLEQGRGEKVINFKRRRRKHGSRRLKGHRQYITTVKVTDILVNGASVAPAATTAPVEEPKADPAPAEAAPAADAPATDTTE